ncbi:MAG: hypothetical protein WCP21_13520 [Armatimonadota bacterium]
MKLRPDLLDDRSPANLQVIQLTTEPDVPASHLYMEAQIFTPDSQRFVLHRSAHAHGSDKTDPQHQYLLCDLAKACALTPLTTETGVTGGSVSPDGQFLYYFVDETEISGGRLTLKRVRLDGTEREALVVVDSALPGTAYRASRLYPLSSISSDGQRITISCYLGDGRTANAPWGLLVFDLVSASAELIIEGPTWCNMHPQYSRSTDPGQCHDILIQENHGNVTDAQGTVTLLVGGDGADIHVIRDDGTNFRNMPWGRDGNEHCQGHQCWRGRSAWAITSTGTRQPSEAQLIEGRETPHAGHSGLNSPGRPGTPDAVRNDLSRDFANPRFYHFATDSAGARLISDCGPLSEQASLWVAQLGEAGVDPLTGWRYLLSPRSTCVKGAHLHPFLSPEGTMGFFNSDESGLLQAYMVTGLDG